MACGLYITRGPNTTLLDVPAFYQYKNRMKYIRPSARFRQAQPASSGQRLFLGLWLAAAITACSFLPDISIIPPGWTVTPSLSPTLTATLTPTITPTPLPIARVGVGDIAFFNGDYDTALLHYSIALQDSPDPLIRAAAKWGEARIYFAQERYNETLTALQTIITEFSQSPHFGQAYYLQGFVYYRLENYQSAADSWQTYLTLRPGFLDAYVQELRGDALFSAKNYAAALPAYTAAIQAPALGDDITLDLKVAASQTQMGNYDTALAMYDSITARAPNDYIKAQAMYESGLVYQTIGQNEAAIGKFRLAVENYPLICDASYSFYSYLSLVALLDADAEVNELDRGLIDYSNGYYDVAIAAFDRYIVANPTNDGTAFYFRALARRDSSFYMEALQDYETFIANYPAHPCWGDAWGEKAFIEWSQKGDYTKAAETLLEFISIVPNSTLSSDYLMSSARIYERSGQYDKAVETWARVANEYADTTQASEAVYLFGIIKYRQGDFTSALVSFNRSLGISIEAKDKARAYLWIGKTQQKLGDNEAALNAWRAGQSLDADGYYSERSRDLLMERAPFTPALSTNLTPNLTNERADADTWMRLTFGIGTDVDLNGLGALGTDGRVTRGNEYWELGLYEKARLEFENLRAELELNEDAEGSYRLMNYFVDLGLYRSAISAARQTLTLAGFDEHTEFMLAPLYFSRIRYGLYYADLITAEAQANGFDPLFLFSVIWQESQFEGFAISNKDARGLMQIVPSTGAEISSELGKPTNYTENDLDRPFVSVMFGVHYLAKNRNWFPGDIYAALAGYNAGPGASQVWKKLSGDDPDLFLESIRSLETRNYIRSIYEIHIIYRRLYGTLE